MPAENIVAGGKDKNSRTDQGRNLDATSRCDFSWLLFVGTKMLGFTEREVGHFSLKKWLLLYKHFRLYHNFCTANQLFKEEKTTTSTSDEWLPS